VSQPSSTTWGGILTGAQNELMLALGLLGVSVYFSVLVVRSSFRLWFARRLRPTALLTWRPRPPLQLRWLMALGLLAAALAVVTAIRERPLFHVYAQAVTALYFVVVAPLASRVPRGLYGGGIWTETGFLGYRRIGRLAFREQGGITLILVPRGHPSGAHRLEVPPGEYGAVRRLLEDQARAGVLKVEQGLLGLE
jgi:hypothetical protein